MMKLSQAAIAIHGTAQGEASFERVGTDSRHIMPGQLFVALRGERFDGHAFVAQSLADGAAAAMVDREWLAANPSEGLPLLVVDDTRRALGALAAAWRSRFTLPVIGVTGSNGKTTVKEMCAAILRAQAALDGADPGAAVVATQGNLNNDIGLPLTVLGLGPAHRYAVFEMGMNKPGEIAYLAGIAAPTVAIVTNAHRAHLAGMGGLDEVAIEKGSIFKGLVEDGTAIINADDPRAADWAVMAGTHRKVRFGTRPDADVSGAYILKGQGATLTVHTPVGNTVIELPVPGRHNVLNALAAIAATLGAGVSIEAVRRGLEGYTGTKGRLERKAGLHAAVVIDDTYNANPDSVRAGIDVLAATPGRTVLVLGDMGEIGPNSAQLHDEVGGYAKSQGIDLLFAMGDMSDVAARNFGEGGRHFGRIEDLVAALRKVMDGDTVVLVKGSRFMRMERVVDAIVVPKN